MTENEQSPKMYYCEEKQAICLIDFCESGKELLHYPEAYRDEHEDESYMGYGKRFIPGEITTHIKFKDGTEKYIDGKIGFFKGCESKSKYSKEFLDTLKQLCLEFDSKAEAYPDPDYVGFALYFYATHPDFDLRPGYGCSIDIQTEFCEGGEDWSKELDNKNEPCSEVKTLKLPENHFVFPITVYEFNNLITTIYSNPLHEKNEFFKSEQPAWLADVFQISNIKIERSFMNEVTELYTVEVYPDDELFVMDEKTLTVMENKSKHEKIGIIIR